MNADNEKFDKENDRRWAPWYVYVVLIIGANYVKQRLLEDAPVIINVIATLIVAVAVFALVTVVYRSVFAGRQR